MAAGNTADLLVGSGAYINVWGTPDKWVRLPDGTVTPAYLSCRRLLGNAAARLDVIAELQTAARERFPGVTCVIGLATAGIVWGDAVADELRLPFGYVRTERKGYGVGGLVEGHPPADTDALLVDDTLLTGESLLLAKEALLRERGIRTAGVLTIASLHKDGPDGFAEVIGAPVHALANYQDIGSAAVAHGVLTEPQRSEMMEYYQDPTGYQFRKRSAG